MRPLIVPPKHICPLIPLVLLILLQQLPVCRIMIRRTDPLPRNHAGQRYANTGRPIQPRRRSLVRQLLTKETGEVIAIVREEIVRRARETLGHFQHNLLDLDVGFEREALEELAAECSTWRLHAGLCPINARDVWPIVAAKRVLPVQGFDNDASVEEATAEPPEGGGEFPRREEVVDVY